MKIILFYLIASILSFSSVTAGGFTGNDWIKYYGKSDVMDNYFDGAVRGFINGKRQMGYLIKFYLTEGNFELKKDPKFGFGINLWSLDTNAFLCSTGESTWNQYIAIVDKYIKNNPEKWHEDIFSIINTALRESDIFSCPVSDYKDHKIQKYIKQTF